MKCSDCDYEMESVCVPSERILFTIPFTEIEIRAVDFNAKKWICVECHTADRDAPFRAAFDAGMESGYERAQDDARRGDRW